jgi:hypothetical protein
MIYGRERSPTTWSYSNTMWPIQKSAPNPLQDVNGCFHFAAVASVEQAVRVATR